MQLSGLEARGVGNFSLEVPTVTEGAAIRAVGSVAGVSKILITRNTPVSSGSLVGCCGLQLVVPLDYWLDLSREFTVLCVCVSPPWPCALY